jgi:hypothetical protein
MSTPIPTNEPTQITQGATVKWSKSFADYPASGGWNLKYYFRGPGAGLDLDVAGGAIVVNGDGWIVTIDNSQSASLGAGINYWQAWIDNGGGESYVLGEGRTQVDAGLGSVDSGAPYDGRSEIKKTLDAIRAAIAGRATQAQLRRSIAGTMIEFMSITELLAAETRWTQLYNAEIRGERVQAGEPLMATIHTRFVLPQ